MFLQLSQGSDPVLELSFPIVPEFLTCLWPIPWRVRDELFSVPYFLGDHFQLWTKKLRALNIVSMQALNRALRTPMRVQITVGAAVKEADYLPPSTLSSQ